MSVAWAVVATFLIEPLHRPGRRFELTALQNAGTTVDIEASVQSWFAIEVVE
jgi:hypothetical protein